MDGFRFSLFGKFACSYGSGEVQGFSSQKVQELLGYLLLQRNRPHNRELLATLLWDNGSSAHAKKNLRQLLWQIHSATCELGYGDALPLLVLDGEWIRIDTSARLCVDVDQFEHAYHAVRGTHGIEVTEDQCMALRKAVSLYRGQLLEGWFQEWCVYERERLHEIYLSMLEKLLGYCECHLDYDDGMAYGNMVLRWDPARERTHRRLMRLQYGTRRRTEALRQYQRCVDALDRELGVAPSISTTRLYEQIVNNEELHDCVGLGVDGTSPAVAASPSVTTQLDEIDETLGLLQHQIQQLHSSLSPNPSDAESG